LSELLIVGLLLGKKTRVAGFYAFIFLMAVFTAYITMLFVTGEKLPCACGGIIQQLSWSGHLVVNVCFIIMSLLSVIFFKDTIKN
jgi:hypothetical protein